MIQNRKQFLLAVKVIAQKQQISKFYPQILSTDTSDYIYISHWSVICKSYLLCLELADKILIFGVLQQWLLQLTETVPF